MRGLLASSSFALLFVAGTCSGQELPRSLFFESSLERALERAARIQRPVLVAIHRAGDEGTREMFEAVYRDPIVKLLSREVVVCVACADEHPAIVDGPRKGQSTVFPGLTPEELKAVDQAVRHKFSDVSSQRPAHLILDPSGNLMKAKEGVLTKDELMQLLKDGLDAVDGDWSSVANGPGAGPGSRPGDAKRKRPADKGPGPNGSAASGLAKGAGATPPWSGIFEADDAVRRATIEELFATGDNALVLNLYRQLREAKDQEAKIEFLRMAAKEGHEPPLPMFTEALEDKDPQVRDHAAVSLEIGRLSAAVALLQKALRKEKEERVIADLVRALGACAHADDAALELVLKYSRERSDVVRANAYVALRFSADKPKVKDALQKKGLSDNDPKARHAAIWTLGFIRDKGSRELLEKAAKKERGIDGSRLLITAAISLIDGADMSPLYLGALRQFTGETISREPAKMPREDGEAAGEKEKGRKGG